MAVLGATVHPERTSGRDWFWFVAEPTKKIERDPLFHKAIEEMDKIDEISSKQLSEALKIDLKRAEAIMDQLEAAGLGTCYMKDA